MLSRTILLRTVCWLQQWREAKEGGADVMALGGDDSGADEDDDDDLEGSGVGGEELFNRCINDTLEAQEVCQAAHWPFQQI